MKPKIVKLSPWEEIVGELANIEEDRERTILHFSYGDVSVPLTVADELQGKIGERLAVLRTDIPNKEYLWREIDND